MANDFPKSYRGEEGKETLFQLQGTSTVSCQKRKRYLDLNKPTSSEALNCCKTRGKEASGSYMA